ncbi:MBL fold metallo-hydrolase [Micromonospora polyrhachis]|uniref:L-ascorbate metabolism protein UlaG (Beta-lactamase superfamily) n=1 Tax=Micromonospora polyrhachis TaxID=1282883 RepID=A0A7W7WTD4_9ACTN|nr:MBL fold metallo-hydrolase [Micromonospora polyrhachis]MBB4962582.1 L-ascorbate metabolism protein UlaG (beta-lactamase superfamily) [Micromonospora polyrhachis]
MAESHGTTTTVTFVGTATTLLNLGDFTLLTDPNFLHAGQRAYLGYGMWTRRRTDPAMSVEDLPALDGVVLSHLHGDHFDRVTRAGLPKDLPIITTPQAQRRLRRWGFAHAEALSTWESQVMTRGNQRLRIISMPGTHGPGIVGRLLPAVMGSIIDFEQDNRRLLRLYVTGDTLNRSMLAEIPQRYPGIDAMLIHLGGTRILGILVTMDDHQGVELVNLVRPRLTLPIHYDDYPVFRSPLQAFLDLARLEGMTAGVRPIRRGETVALPQLATPPPA